MGYKLKRMIRKVRGNKNSNLVAIPTYIKIKLDVDEGDLIEFKET